MVKQLDPQEVKARAQITAQTQAQVSVEASELNLDALIKFGCLEKELEPISGWKITMHALNQKEREAMAAFILDENSLTMYGRGEAIKIPTIAFAITRINGERFETDAQKKVLIEKLQTAQGTTVDLLYIEYNKLFTEQFELLQTGIKKK